MNDQHCTDGCNSKSLFDKLPQATPTLYGEDAVKFIKNIEEGLKNPTGPVSTPKLKLAVKKVLEYAKKLNITNVG